MDELLQRVGEALERVRASRPLVMCLTNSVVTNWTANCLLALGARPAMVDEPEEAEELAAHADAALLNLGTVSEHQAEALRTAAWSCGRCERPWVLDPVAVHLLAYRRQVAFELIAQKPTIIRGNAQEIEFLKGSVPSESVLLATGEVDEIAGTVPVIRLANGTEMLTRVTGTGCAQGALAAAFCAVTSDARVAAVSSSLTMAVAGELAAEKADAPGSFAVALLDALAAVTPDDLAERARFS